ncbi:MAG: S8 family serine peptidase, partial [Bacteroidota bacterium]
MKNSLPLLRSALYWFILSYAFGPTFIRAQYYINEEWQSSYGFPSEIDWSASAVDQTGNIITVGNTLVGANQIDILVTQYDDKGKLIWQQQFNAPLPGKAYGVAVVLDAQDNIYVAGAVQAGAGSNGLDLALIKYNNSGVAQWSTLHNNSNREDIPTDLLVTSSGKIYLTGLTYDPGNFSDYLTVQLDASGTVQWQKVYDYNGLHDVPIAVELDGSGNVVVTGGSASSLTNWDYATVKYDSQGVKLNESRVSSPGNGFDEPTALQVDGSGNFYITGTSSSNGVDYDLRLIKLDQDLNLVWESTFDGNERSDRGNDLAIAVDGSVYVAGYTENSEGQNEYLLLKYTATGTKLWEQKWKSGDSAESATGRKVVLNANGLVVLTGEISNGDQAYVYTLGFDANGNRQWEKKSWTNGGRNRPVGLIANPDGSLFLNVYSKVGNEAKYRTSKLTSYYRNIRYAYDSLNQPIYIRKELLVHFNESVVNEDFTMDKKLVFARVDTVIRDTALLAILGDVLAYGRSVRDWKLLKIYSDYTPADTLVNCGRKEIRVPQLWNSFILVGEGKGFNEETAAKSLDSISGNYIRYAETNRVWDVYCDPSLDGVEAGEQHSLCDLGTFNDADINMTGAWTYAEGSSAINVAIFDSGIRYRHEDFGFPNGDYGGIEGSVVQKLWDCTVSTPVALDENTPVDELDVSGHGTACAGIVGAVRHNEKGIAGIAGGSTSQAGVSLQGYLIGDTPITTAVSTAFGKVLGRLEGNTCPAQGVDIVNMSIGVSGNGLRELRRNVEYAYKAGLIMVAARGNSGTDNLGIPSTYPDDRIISVGASGNDGNYKNATNGDPSNPNDNYETNYGQGMDLIAPGSNDLTQTVGIGSESEYVSFSGTSSAAPHAAGVAALLLQYHQDEHGLRLATEDVEHLLQYGAVDLNNGGGSTGEGNTDLGYDEQSGWGKLNATNSLALIDGCQKVVHVTADATNFEEIDCVDPNDCNNNLGLAEVCLLD